MNWTTSVQSQSEFVFLLHVEHTWQIFCFQESKICWEWGSLLLTSKCCGLKPYQCDEGTGVVLPTFLPLWLFHVLGLWNCINFECAFHTGHHHHHHQLVIWSSINLSLQKFWVSWKWKFNFVHFIWPVNLTFHNPVFIDTLSHRETRSPIL
jgi:hypothetical protein